MTLHHCVRDRAALAARRGRARVCVCTLVMALVLPALSACSPNPMEDALRSGDRDADGLSDALEAALGTDPDDPDTDLDGLQDGEEISGGTSPLAADSDGDGLGDGDDPELNAPSGRTGSVSSGNDVEPNDTFAQAVVLPAVEAAGLILQGRIDLESDIDVFGLGTLAPGDRIHIESETVADAVTPLVAIFDDMGAVFYIADGRIPLNAQRTRLVRETIRHGPAGYFVAITHAVEAFTLGAYRLHVTIEFDTEPVPPMRQVLFLDFDGGVLDRSLLGVSETGPFDAADISPLYTGDTQAIKETIVETVLENFADFDVVVVTSDEMAEAPEPATTLLLGAFHESAFGVSEGVDPYNEDPCDNGIIFTETFKPFAFGFAPSPVRVGVAIGNVTAHEAGHLMGLYHVTDPTALMDEASPAVVLLTDQEFKEAPLAESAFPLGSQDAGTLLDEAVGLR